jgi:hypothetical protein
MPYLTRSQQVLAGVAAVLAIAGGAYRLVYHRPRPMRCVAVDVTNPSLTGIYTVQIRTDVRQAAKDGTRLKLLPFAGSPKVESVPIETSFAGLTDLQRRGVIRDAVKKFDDEALALQGGDGAGKLQAGSGIVDALDKINDGERCDGGLTALTDALERRAFDVYHSKYLTRSGRADVLDAMKDANSIPKLNGIAVSMPYGGTTPDGSVISKDPARVSALHPMFDAIVRAGGGTLNWGS